MNIQAIYQHLRNKHGPQGWWPVLDQHGNQYYHQNDFTFPKNQLQQFIICIGAILTQSVAWKNVEKALKNLHDAHYLDPNKIISAHDQQLASLIKPAGYYNQKAKKLKIFSKFFIQKPNPTRIDLLSLWGIGKETADSMLLYAYKQPHFVIDTYTQRLFIRENIIQKKWEYDQLAKLINNNIPKNINIYQEFHALIVREMKI